jgi:hypothetical protein
MLTLNKNDADILFTAESKPRPDTPTLNSLIQRYGGGLVITEPKRLTELQIAKLWAASQGYSHFVVTSEGEIEMRY